jgi:hypothetical protein
MKLQDATRAIALKSLKEQPDGFIADFNGVNEIRHTGIVEIRVRRQRLAAAGIHEVRSVQRTQLYLALRAPNAELVTADTFDRPTDR